MRSLLSLRFRCSPSRTNSTAEAMLAGLFCTPSLATALLIPTAEDAPDPNGYYLDRELTTQNSRWDFRPVSVGGSPDIERPYWIGLYLLDATDSPAADNPGGRRSLPPDATKVAEVMVRRGTGPDNATGPLDADSGGSARSCAPGDGP